MRTRRPARANGPLLAGLLAWSGGVLLLPAPLAARILLLAPLVIVPRLLALLPPRSSLTKLAGWPALLAALPLALAFALPAGLPAGAFVLPWLALSFVAAAVAIRHGLSVLPSILDARQIPGLGVDVALGFWAVGATFALTDRLGLETQFSAAIVLLTATHFHFAGLGLLAVASLLAVLRPWLCLPVVGLAIGIPVTALGFVVASDLINAVGALLVGLSGIGVAVALLSERAGARRGLHRLAGLALLVGMPMGIAWSLAILFGQPFLDLDVMVRTHGVLNASAVLLAVVSHRTDDE